MTEADSSDLRAVVLDHTPEPSSDQSHSQVPADDAIAPGMPPDTAGHGFDGDDRPGLRRRVPAADILLLTTPSGSVEASSVRMRVVERARGGLPAHGDAQAAGSRFGHPDPEAR